MLAMWYAPYFAGIDDFTNRNGVSFLGGSPEAQELSNIDGGGREVVV